MFSCLKLKKSENEISITYKDVMKVLRKYPDKIPIYVQVVNNLPTLKETKFIVPKHLTIGEFLFICRKRLTLSPEQGIFIFFNNKLYSTSKTIQEIYDENKLDSGLLVATVSGENTFGKFI